MAGKELGNQPRERLVEPIVFRRRQLGESDQAESFSVRNPTLRRIPAAPPASHPARNSSEGIAEGNRKKSKYGEPTGVGSCVRIQVEDFRLLCLSYAFQVLINMIFIYLVY